MRTDTLRERRRLYLLSRAVVARHYRQPLTLASVARALASSPRQLQRAYAHFGETSFHEDLHARRMAVAADLLATQPAVAVRDVARLVGLRHAPHFARAFRRRYGLSPTLFRARARRHAAAGRMRARQTAKRSAPESPPLGSGGLTRSSSRRSSATAQAPVADTVE